MAYRSKVASAPALVKEVINTTSTRRNASIFTLQQQMESTSTWLDDAITATKRKIVEGTGVSIQEVNAKKPKVIGFKKENGAPLSPIPDKENSPNLESASRARIKPPPSAVKRRVNGLRVVDLREELTSKGIEHKKLRLKKDLQQRLLDAYSTVENMMSPQKAQPNNNHSISSGVGPVRERAVSKDPPAAKADDGFPDTESVEVVVFESSTDAQEQRPVKADNAKQAAQGVTKSASASQTSVDVATSKPTASAEKEVEQKSFEQNENESMEVEPTKEANASMDDSRSSSSSSKSMMDCSTSATSSAAEMAKAPCARAHSATFPKPANFSSTSVVAKALSSIESSKKPAVPKVTLSTDPQQPPQDKESNFKPRISVASMSSRKVSQESSTKSSPESARSSYSAKAEGEADEALEAKSRAAVSKPAEEKEDDESKPREKSPIKRRVQAAIQMLTAKSPAKPKPTTTPGKLPWLQNKSQYPATDSKVAAQLAAQNLKQQEAQQPMTSTKQEAGKPVIATSLRRPGVGGLASSVSSTSTSASKPTSKFAAGSSSLASSEARKARIAEMREKSNKAAQPSAYAAKAYGSTLSSSKGQATGSNETKDTKRKLLTAQMRAKAARNLAVVSAAGGLKPIDESSAQSTGHRGKANVDNNNNNKHLKGRGAQVSGTTKPVVSYAAKAMNELSKQQQQSEARESKRVHDEDGKQAEEKEVQADNTRASKPAQAQQTKRHAVKEPVTRGAGGLSNGVEAALPRPQPPSPMDTYEISDREDSGSDSDSEEEDESESEDEYECREPRKKIPEWAQKVNLLPALEKQFAAGEPRLDPDEIFPEVRTCDLTAIFGANEKKSRYMKRTSSGNWSRDRVTAAEKLTYKRTMGYGQKRK